MRASLPILALLLLQALSALSQELTPDLHQILSDDAALSSVEISYSVKGQLVVMRGDGSVFVQSTQQQLPLILTCKGKVQVGDVRNLVETMGAVKFLDLPQRSYLLINEDRERLQIHAIAIKTSGGSAKREFSAGTYDGKRQELPENFTTLEKAISALRSSAIRPGTQCTIAQPL